MSKSGSGASTARSATSREHGLPKKTIDQLKERIENKLKAEFKEKLKAETLALRQENVKLQRKRKTDAMNVGLFDTENVDQKLIAMENLHSAKTRALQKSIENYRLEIKKIQAQNTESARTKKIQGLKVQLKESELKVDLLKELLAKREFDGRLGDDLEDNMSEVNHEVIKLTIGGPKRFRPKSREELIEELKEEQKKNMKAQKRLMRKNDDLRQTVAAYENKADYEGKVAEPLRSAANDSDRSTGNLGTTSSDNDGKIVELMGEIKERDAELHRLKTSLNSSRAEQEEVRDENMKLRPLINDVKRLKEEIREKDSEIEVMHADLKNQLAMVVRLQNAKERQEEEMKHNKEVWSKKHVDQGTKQESLKSKIAVSTSQIQALQKEINDLRGEKSLQTSISEDLNKATKSQLEEEKKRNAELEESLRQMQGKFDTSMAKVDSMHEQINDLTAKILEQEKKNVELEKDCEVLKTTAKSEVEKAELFKLQLEKMQEAHSEERKNQHDTSKSSMSRLEQEKEKFENQIKQLTAQVEQKMEELDQTRKQKSELEATLKKSEMDFESRAAISSDGLAELKEKLAAATEQVDKLTREKNTLKKKNKEMKEMQKQLIQKANQQATAFKMTFREKDDTIKTLQKKLEGKTDGEE